MPFPILLPPRHRLLPLILLPNRRHLRNNPRLLRLQLLLPHPNLLLFLLVLPLHPSLPLSPLFFHNPAVNTARDSPSPQRALLHRLQLPQQLVLTRTGSGTAGPSGIPMSKGCLAELSSAEMGEPGWTAFWNSFSCCAMLVVMLLLAVMPPDVDDGTVAIGYSSSRSGTFSAASSWCPTPISICV
jgi:hypothetical protein